MDRRLRWNALGLVIAFLGSALIPVSQLRADQIELSPDSVIGGTGSWAGANFWDEGQFRAQLVADNQFEDEIDEQEQSPDDETGGFWLGKESDEEEAFVLDLEQAYTIDEIQLYNTHNATFDDRATFGYEIHGSNSVAPFDTGEVGEGGDDLVDAVLMSEGELELAYFADDPLLPQSAVITNSGPFRYIRFSTVGPFHEDDVILPQRSVGINEIKVFGSPGVGDPLAPLDDGTITDPVARANYVHDVLGTWVGDSNLDGQFSSADFVAVFTAGEYEDGVEDNSSWVTGDWNGDKDFDSSDFVAAFTDGGFEKGTWPPANNAVPEPSSLPLIAVGLVGLMRRRRR